MTIVDFGFERRRICRFVRLKINNRSSSIVNPTRSQGASMASAQGSTGVDQDRGMCEEKRNDDRPAEGGTLNSGRLIAPDVGEIYLQRPNAWFTSGSTA
jgi:hypothetical protein